MKDSINLTKVILFFELQVINVDRIGSWGLFLLSFGNLMVEGGRVLTPLVGVKSCVVKKNIIIFAPDYSLRKYIWIAKNQTISLKNRKNYYIRINIYLHF